MSDVLIATIGKNAREEIRISLSQFNGFNLASIRVWFQAEDGTMRPGKAGLAFRIDKLPDIIEALGELEAEAQRRGFIGGQRE